jgi:hypothetical protein
MHDHVIANPTPHRRVPWNKGKLTGAKPPRDPNTSGRSGRSSRLKAAFATLPCSIWRLTASCVAVTSTGQI